MAKGDDFLPFEPKKLARTGDPETSHQAAESSKEMSARHHRIILSVFTPGVRLATQQVADLTELTHAQVWRRMALLEREGILRVTDEKHRNISGKMAQRYERVTHETEKSLRDLGAGDRPTDLHLAPGSVVERLRVCDEAERSGPDQLRAGPGQRGEQTEAEE